MKIDMNVDAADFLNTCSVSLSRVARGTRIATQEGANAILAAAQARCPIYSGTLRNSGEVTVHGSSANNYSPGFAAVIRFGGGNAVNPFTGKHPSEYAAAVHEGYAINPVTGEYSRYKSGEEKFLEKAVRDFEQTGLHKLAYKHWGNALNYFKVTQDYKGSYYRTEMSGVSGPGFEALELTRRYGGDRKESYTVVSDKANQRDFFGNSLFSKERRGLTMTLMGVDKETPGVTDESLYYAYVHNLRVIKQAHIHFSQAATQNVFKVSEEAIALAEAFKGQYTWHVQHRVKPKLGAEERYQKQQQERKFYEGLLDSYKEPF